MGARVGLSMVAVARIWVGDGSRVGVKLAVGEGFSVGQYLPPLGLRGES